MNISLAIGGIATLLGIVGYVAGIFTPYPGRAFSLTFLMFGMALALAGRSGVADSA